MRRADAPNMDPDSGEWRPGDVRLWTKDELSRVGSLREDIDV